MNTSSNIYKKHLTLSKRIQIEGYLNEGKAFTEIAELTGKNYKTIYNEVKKHRKLIKCNRYGVSPKYNMNCDKTNKHPFVCNACPSNMGCRKNKYKYFAEDSHINYKNTLSESRSGMNMNEEQFQNLKSIVVNSLEKNHSFYMIHHYNKIPVSIKTLYNYQSKGYFDVSDLYLPRKVRYKVRKKKEDVVPRNTKHRKNRTYQDFLKYKDDFFIENEYDVEVVLMDTVEGIKGEDESVLLTLLFTSTNFLMAFKLPNKTSDAVSKVFNDLKDDLGNDMFSEIFRCILTDNGSEFSNPDIIEDNGEWLEKTRVFYCNPNRSDQKAKIEVAHEYIRRFFPKGTSFNDYTQEDITLMINHINSVCRDHFKGQCPLHLQILFTYENFFRTLGYKYIRHNEIILSDDLFKQKDTK